jgi:hypothetical protein
LDLEKESVAVSGQRAANASAVDSDGSTVLHFDLAYISWDQDVFAGSVFCSVVATLVGFKALTAPSRQEWRHDFCETCQQILYLRMSYLQNDCRGATEVLHTIYDEV